MPSNESVSPTDNANHLDAIVVGGGFGGCYMLHLLRKRGYNVKLIEALDYFGGVWRGNWYPGARVDCEMPYYSLSAPELLQNWTWTEKFPGAEELRRYFKHVDDVWDLSKDAYFNSKVIEARFNEASQRWSVTTQNNLRFSCRWFLSATGTSNKQYVPEWPDVSKYKGDLYHPAAWPRDDPYGVLDGKRVAVIGAGASAIQIVQEAAKRVTHLTQYVRTINLCLPMQQRSVSSEEVEARRPQIHEEMEHVRNTMQGLPIEMVAKTTQEASPEEREAVWSRNWELGGFHFPTASFSDLVIDVTANRLAYEFWRREVSKRVPDPAKRAILAPEKQPHWVGTKRPSMEQDYYEMVSKPNVDIVTSPIKSFDETGITTADGPHCEFDLIVVATGYDSITGTLKEMNIIGHDSKSLSDHWSDGTYTHLGVCVSGFPNMFFVYGPQAPSPLTSGPPFIEQQVEWVCDVIDKAKQEGWQVVEATRQAEIEWANLTAWIANQTLFSQTDSWYMGANIPGKKREPLVFLGGMNLYFEKCRDALDGMKGFDVVTGDVPQHVLQVN